MMTFREVKPGHTIYVFDRVKATMSCEKVADAAQVFDSALQKNQQYINKEFKNALAKKKRIFIKHYSSSKTYEGMFAYVIPGETIKFGVYTSAKNNISIEAIAFNSSKENPTITVANPVSNSFR